MAEYIERENLLKVLPPKCNMGDMYATAYNTCLNTVENLIKEQPTADVVEVVRCKDCVYCVDLGASGLYCDHDDNRNPLGCRPNDYCNDGERRGSNE